MEDQKVALKMQGSWCMQIKNAANNNPQRFVISDAKTGNGIYNIKEGMPQVYADGENWTFHIEKNPGNGFVPCPEQIRFPYTMNGKYQFDIEAAARQSTDNNHDTAITCCTPQTTSDYLIYGNVSAYDDPCFFNPFYHFWIVLETRDAFYEALKYDSLRQAIKRLYLDRLAKEILMPETDRISEPFIPIIIPLHDETIIPPSMGQVLKIEPFSSETAETTEQFDNYSIISKETFLLNQAKKLDIEINRVALCNVFDHVLPRCVTESLPGIELEFFEYFRTNMEFCGGPFTGGGKRKRIGSCIADHNGNYIFRFKKSETSKINKSILKFDIEKDASVQIMPDIVIRLRQNDNKKIIHETIPYWNIPLFKRINICFPKKKITKTSGETGSESQSAKTVSKKEIFSSN
ncbi:MAG: hypothetical protein P8X42_01355 [Calditrichaceae bacterium]